MDAFGAIILTVLFLGIIIGFPAAISYQNGKIAGRIEGQNDYYKQLVDPCQAELPRNQSCEVIAVPEKPE